MNAQRLHELVERFPACRIAVLGDYFLDKYLDVDPALAEISLETGKPAHQVVSIRSSPGAAGTVVNNLAALGAGVIHALGFTGDDGEGFELRRELTAIGCDLGGLVRVPDRFTPTYLKPRDARDAGLAGERERYDTKNRRPAPADVQDRVLSHLAGLLPGLDAVILLDQVEEADCGIVTRRLRDAVAQIARRWVRTVFWADSRCRIGSFRDVIIKVNAHEAVREVFGRAGGGGDDFVVRAIAGLRGRTGRPVVVTAGGRGIWVSDPAPTLVPAVRVAEPTDPTGAGDSATAAAVLALSAGATLGEAAVVANLAASITIQQLATTGTASRAELGPRLALWRSQMEGSSNAFRA